MLGAGVPGRHAPFAHDFADHRCPTDDLVVARHGERTNLAVAMAAFAAILEDARHLAGIGDGRILLRYWSATDQAPRSMRRSQADFATCQQIFERVGQVLLCGRRPLIADACLESVLVVDPPAI